MSLFTQRVYIGLMFISSLYMIAFYIAGLSFMYSARGLTENRVREDFLFVSFWIGSVLIGLTILGTLIFGPIIWYSKRQFESMQIRLSPSPV